MEDMTVCVPPEPSVDSPLDFFHSGAIWRKGGVLGEGAYGKVHKYITHGTQLDTIAVKFFISDEHNDDVHIVRFMQQHCAYDYEKDGMPWVVGARCISVNDKTAMVMKVMDGCVQDISRYMSVSNITNLLISFTATQATWISRYGMAYTDIKETNLMFKRVSPGNVSGIQWKFVDIGGFAIQGYPGVATYPIPGTSAVDVPACERVCLWNIFLFGAMFLFGGASIREFVHGESERVTPRCHAQNNEEISRVEAKWKSARQLSTRIRETLDAGLGNVMGMVVEEVYNFKQPNSVGCTSLNLYIELFTGLTKHTC